MENTMQYICDAEGQKVAVIVPIDLWQEILAEKETAYLLSSLTMKERLLTARDRQNGIPLEEACAKLGI
ncbi:MAG: prevent-host-death protein [Coleofasciculaceae cyanobacterium SM2_1_6]|nr:prevent-host-death protein [Coleofasciculaceae cyanobacterium SM2_1_6]